MRSSPFLVLLVVAAACGEPFSNEDIVFLKSLPNRDLLRVDVPADRPGEPEPPPADDVPACPMEPPRYYRDTVNTSRQINASIAAVLEVVDGVTVYPPSERTPALRRWGPFEDDGNELELVIARTGTPTYIAPLSSQAPIYFDEGLFAYEMRARPAGTERWLVPFSGTFAPAGTARRGLGTLVLDFDAIAGLGSSAPMQGVFHVGYDTRGGAVAIELALEQGTYTFEEDAEKNGAFVFSVAADVHSGEESPRPALERLGIHARWRSDGSGRTDVVASGGDLALPAYASECWDAAFLTTYTEWKSAEIGAQCGTEARCPEGLRSAEHR